MEKRNKIVIGILTVLLVIVGIVAVYFAISANSVKKNTDELKAQVEEANASLKEATDKNFLLESDLNESNEKLNTIKETLGVSDTTSSNTESSFTTSVVDFENGKCLNSKDGRIYTPGRKSSLYTTGIVASLSQDGKTVSVTIDYGTMNKIYGTSYTNNNEEYKITNFSKKVVNVFVYGKGQSAGEEYVLFLLEDGTVEYMKVADAVKNQNFKSSGKIDGVTNIVDIINGGARQLNSTGDGGAGWITIYAINSDGDYYDIGEILE